jgi:predicted permease
MSTELRHAVRGLVRDRAFTITVVLSLAVGIGANTAIFSLVNGILLRPPDYREPERLVSISQIIPKFAKLYPALPVNVAILFEWRKQSKLLESIAASRPDAVNLTGTGEPELLSAAKVTSNYFTVLGIQPRLGRSFMEAEDADGHEHVVVLTDSLWRRRFQADPAIVGRKVLLNGSPFQVIGVLPASFQFPGHGGGFAIGAAAKVPEVFRTIGFTPDDLKLHLGDFNYWTIARMKPGATVAKAAAEMSVIESGISSQIPENPGLRIGMEPLQERMVGDSRSGLLLVMGAVGAVLLILWVNLANLSLVRAAGRARESAIRTALGAGRWRMVRQSLTESMVLALTGGAAGVALAYAGLQAVLAAPVNLPRLSEVRVDLTVLGFALAVSLAAGALLGILPAWRSAASAPYETLKSSSRTSTEGRGGLRVRNALVSLEAGLSTTLLVTAGLLTTSFMKVMSVDKGFNIERVMALDLSLPGTKYPDDDKRTAFFKRVMEQAAALPGVQAVSLVSALPLEGETWIDIVGTEHDTRPLVEKPSTNVRFISPGYFATLQMPLAGGRDFDEALDKTRPVTIISARLAKLLWPGQDAIGRKLSNGSDKPLEVVGVTPDVHSTSLDHDPVNMLYRPYWQRSRREGSLLVRTAMDPRGMAPALRSTVWSIDNEVPIPEVRTLEQVMAKSVAQRRFQMLLVGLFAAAALALAAFGLYGVVAYSVARRRAEMGIRMALGAGKGTLLGMILRQGLAPVAAGLAAGAVGAVALARFIASLLFQVSPKDWLPYAAAVTVLLAVSAAACVVPARRAAGMNPVEALRFE